MGHRLRLSGPANEDIRSIWEYTRSTYDYRLAIAYFELLEQAIRDIVADPERPSSIPRPDLGAGVRSYHIELSKHRSGTGRFRGIKHGNLRAGNRTSPGRLGGLGARYRLRRVFFRPLDLGAKTCSPADTA